MRWSSTMSATARPCGRAINAWARACCPRWSKDCPSTLWSFGARNYNYAAARSFPRGGLACDGLAALSHPPVADDMENTAMKVATLPLAEGEIWRTAVLCVAASCATYFSSVAVLGIILTAATVQLARRCPGGKGLR